jgi:hypothetical protein
VRLQRLQVVFRQFNWPLAPAPSPLIAFNTAEKTLTVVVDFDQRLITLFAPAGWHGSMLACEAVDFRKP